MCGSVWPLTPRLYTELPLHHLATYHLCCLFSVTIQKNYTWMRSAVWPWHIKLHQIELRCTETLMMFKRDSASFAHLHDLDPNHQNIFQTGRSPLDSKLPSGAHPAMGQTNPQNPSHHLDCHFWVWSVGFFHFQEERMHRHKAIFSHWVPVNFLSYVSLFAAAFSAVRQKANQRLLPLGQVTPAWTKRESNIIPSLSVPRARSPIPPYPCSEKTLVLVIWKLQEIFI